MMSNKISDKSRALTAVETAGIDWQHNYPRPTKFSDIYFSGTDSYEETQHVFIAANRLRERWELPGHDSQHAPSPENKTAFTIVETGFGTGLNFLATAQLWLTQGPDSGLLHFVSVEILPLSHYDLTKALQAWPSLSPLSSQLLAQYPPPIPGFHRIYINDPHDKPRIALTLIFEEAVSALEQLRSNDHPRFKQHRQFIVDAWYLDGFAPAKNPAIWTTEIFQGMAQLSGPQTTLSTFTAADMVRRGLRDAGFNVNKVPGYSRKRDMLIGVFKTESEPEQTEISPAMHGHRKKNRVAPPWYIEASPQARSISRRKHIAKQDAKHAAIIGGGIAACSTAHALALRGWQVTLYEKANRLAAGGSGNPQGIIYPRLSIEASFLSRFNLTALLFASRFYSSLWNKGGLQSAEAGARCGVLVLPEKASDLQVFNRIANNFHNCREFVTLLNQTQIQAVSGISLHATSALYFPSLGWVDPGKVCQHLSEHRNIHVEQSDISELSHDLASDRWLLKSANNRTTHNAKIVVLATSHQTNNFSLTQHLPLKAIRGQISIGTATRESRALKTVICGAGYMAPAYHGIHTLGATYNLDTTTEQVRDSDHRLNLETLQLTDGALPQLLGQPQISALEGRASLRCTTPDYLPLLGPAPKYENFLSDFAPLRNDARADIPASGSYWPGLYLHCGLGSRGFTYAPLGAELLTGLIEKQAPALPRDLQIALHPARFIIRDLKRKRI